jgi:hypothetical protein
MGETAPYRLEVLEWDEWNYPVKLSVNGNVYQSLDSGLFFIPLKDIEDLGLDMLGNLGISVIVVERVEEGGREIVGIPYTILDTEVQYTGSRAYARIFQFKPRKHLHVRSGGRKVFFMDVLEAYFYALGMVEKLDPRVIPAHKDGWHFDSEIAEAYLEIELKPDMTVKQAVEQVKGIFRKIDQLAANIFGDILREKERKKGV